MPNPRVVHNQSASRFEISADGGTSFVTYHLTPGAIIFDHTETPPALQGKGLAGIVVQEGLNFAREQKLKVVPFCPFVAAYIQKNRENFDLLRDDYRERLS